MTTMTREAEVERYREAAREIIASGNPAWYYDFTTDQREGIEFVLKDGRRLPPDAFVETVFGPLQSPSLEVCSRVGELLALTNAIKAEIFLDQVKTYVSVPNAQEVTHG